MLPNHRLSTQAQADALNFANGVISDVRYLMPYGAGNLAADVERTGGKSAARTQLAYDHYEKIMQEK